VDAALLNYISALCSVAKNNPDPVVFIIADPDQDPGLLCDLNLWGTFIFSLSLSLLSLGPVKIIFFYFMRKVSKRIILQMLKIKFFTRDTRARDTIPGE
jgi:hypothetical protein